MLAEWFLNQLTPIPRNRRRRPVLKGDRNQVKPVIEFLEDRRLLSGTANLTYPIVDTGQTKCYDAVSEISAPSQGQAFFGQDAQVTGAQPSYTLSGDSKTVLDNITGLTWMRGPNTTLTAPVASDKKTFTAAQAWVATVNAMNYGGFNDWRLPTIKELYSLMNFNGTDPSGFTGTNTSVLTPFVNTNYFNFAYGQTSAGERIIDSQYVSSTVFVVTPPQATSLKVFGLNLADGRIKGYDLQMPGGSEKTFFVQLVRGSTDYGINNFTDNGDSTVTDAATSLMWSRADSGTGLTWQNALAWVQAKNAANYLGHNDWRLPNAKELQSLVDYANAPEYNGKPAIDTTYFTCTAITNENGTADYPFYWSSTTHAGYTTSGTTGDRAVYISFGEALGWPANGWVDVHGAGAQRSDPKVGPPYSYATTHTVTQNGTTYTGYAFGPQGDNLRGLNFVRLVRDTTVTNNTAGVTGTNNADIIKVAPNTDKSLVLITVNGKISSVSSSQVSIQAKSGNDIITVNTPAFPEAVDGGDGNDKLIVNGQTGANTFVLTSSSLTVNGVAVTWANIESLTINGLTGSDSLTVESLPSFPVVFNGSTGTDTLTGPDATSQWQITGSSINAGLLNGTLQFIGVENLTGGSGNDTFLFNPSRRITGKVDGGGGSNILDFSLYTTPVTVNLQTSTSTPATNFANIATILGGKSTADKLIGPNDTNTWDISGKNTGEVNGTVFQNMEYLTGGSGDDTFLFADTASISGKIDGGTGTNDALDYSAYSTAISVNLQLKKTTGITGGFANIEEITGGTTVNSLTGPSRTNTWTVTGADSGTLFDGLATYTFTNFANLTGGAGADTFRSSGTWTGKLDGGLGLDTLVGNDDADHAWTITQANAGTYDGNTFANIENLKGGSQGDTFTLAAGQRVTGKIDGGTGSDVLDYSAFTTAVSVNLQFGQATSTAGILNLEQFRAGSGTSNTLTAMNLANAWELSATNAGTITNSKGTYSFTGFQNLTGGSLSDAFTLSVTDGWTGFLQGGLGTDTLTAFADGNVWTPTTLNGHKFGSIEVTQ